MEYIALQFVHRWKFVPPITTCPLYFYCSFLVGFLQSHLPLMMGHLIWWSARYRRHCQIYSDYYLVYDGLGFTFLLLSPNHHKQYSNLSRFHSACSTYYSIRSDDPSSAGGETAKIQPGTNSKNIKDHLRLWNQWYFRFESHSFHIKTKILATLSVRTCHLQSNLLALLIGKSLRVPTV